MKIKHEHRISVVCPSSRKGQAWVANAITEEYLRGAANCLVRARTGTISRISITVG